MSERAVENLKLLMEMLSTGTLEWLAEMDTNPDLTAACYELLRDRKDVKQLKDFGTINDNHK